MLTLQNPRATARLRLNVKGFNMGENSPWLTLNRGWRFRPAVSLDPASCRTSMASILRFRSSRDPRRCRLPCSRYHQFGAPEFSPLGSPWRATRCIDIRTLPLEYVSPFVPTLYDEDHAGHRDRERRRKYTD